MRKIILTILLSLTLFANSDSCKLDVYFGNEVCNNSKQAEASMLKLKYFMQDHSPQKFTIENEGVTYNFKNAHNETYGVINDLIETHWQLYESGQISKMYFSFAAGALNGLDNTNPANSAYIQRLQNIINHYNLNTGVMLNQYRDNSFSKNHNVLLVAHSQGNLFGNKMYELFSSDEKKRFAMVSVATPADHVAKGGGYTTLDNDPVIMLIPDSLQSNASGYGHSFVESYLNNPIYKSVEAIANNINDAVNILSTNGQCEDKCHDAQSGIITISLRWSDPQINMSLNSEIGTKDVSSTECSPLEHYYVKSQKEISTGVYGVYVNSSGGVSESSLPPKCGFIH